MTQRAIAAVLAAFAALLVSPLILRHQCDAGNVQFEMAMTFGAIGALVAGVTLISRRGGKFLFLFVLVPVAMLGLNRAYSDWIHGPHSPWPATATMLPPPLEAEPEK